MKSIRTLGVWVKRERHCACLTTDNETVATSDKNGPGARKCNNSKSSRTLAPTTFNQNLSARNKINKYIHKSRFPFTVKTRAGSHTPDQCHHITRGLLISPNCLSLPSRVPFACSLHRLHDAQARYTSPVSLNPPTHLTLRVQRALYTPYRCAPLFILPGLQHYVAYGAI